MADKKTTDMTISELEKAIPSMSDADLQAAYAAEKGTDGHTERSGAIKALEGAAEDRNVTLTDPDTPSDAELSETTEGAQPAGPNATAEEREDHAETLRALTDRVAQLEAAGGGVPEGSDFDARKEVLRLHRQLEALSNHLNFRLPA